MLNKKNKIDTIKTYGIKYIGSKLNILPYIIETVQGLNIHSVLDGFSGSTRVSQAFAKLGYRVTSNDSAIWSKIFAICFLKAKKSNHNFYQKIIDELNGLQGYCGWFTKNYGDKSSVTKYPFQTKNLMKLDAIRDRIDQLNLNEIDQAVILTSLIFALDKVDSTLGHFSSYLANWSPRSYKNLWLEVPKIEDGKVKHTVLQQDIFKVIKKRKFDLAYYDPPYGSNNEKMPPSRVRYAAYYHFWTTVILNDKPELFGKAGRRVDTRDTIAYSAFEDFRKNDDNHFIATQSIQKLIKLTHAKYILFSYSNGGRATKQELTNIFNQSAKLVKIIEIDYKKNVMSVMKWTNAWAAQNKKNVEYLFLLKK